MYTENVPVNTVCDWKEIMAKPNFSLTFYSQESMQDGELETTATHMYNYVYNYIYTVYMKHAKI